MSNISNPIHREDARGFAGQIALMLGDNTLILAQRLAEWCGHGPVLEQDIAMTNISLDLLGQSRLYLQYAADCLFPGKNDDDLAFFRDTHQFRNVLLVERPNGDWGVTIMRQFFFDAWHYYYVQDLKNSADPALAEIAQKAHKEIAYHLRFSSEWVVRLGDGTELSRSKMQQALQTLWPFTGELLQPSDYEQTATTLHIAPNLDDIARLWRKKVELVLQEATIDMPKAGWMQSGGKSGRHTEQLGFILAEMQHLQRTYPHLQW